MHQSFGENNGKLKLMMLKGTIYVAKFALSWIWPKGLKKRAWNHGDHDDNFDDDAAGRGAWNKHK